MLDNFNHTKMVRFDKKRNCIGNKIRNAFILSKIQGVSLHFEVIFLFVTVTIMKILEKKIVFYDVFCHFSKLVYFFFSL